MATEGMFGSNIGGSKGRLLPLPELKPAPAVKFAHPALKAAPKTHIAALHVPASLLPKTASASSSGALMPTIQSSPGPASGGGGSAAGGALGFVEGFIGHLSSDVVHMAMGMPIGLVDLVEHPIAGAEGMVKATWADWSPLFHGNIDQWSHNFYQHPLAPILDLVGFATFGAGTAARVAGAASHLAEGADVASKLATGADAGAIATKLARFANPMKVAAAENTAKTLEHFAKLGRSAYTVDAAAAGGKGLEGAMTDEAHAYLTHLNQMDSRINRTVMGPAGDTMAKQWAHNPVTRMLEKGKAEAGRKVAARSESLSKVVGDAAVYKRWAFLDKGRRAAAAAGLIQRQITHLSKTGKLLSEHTAGEVVGAIHPGIWKIMADNSRSIRNDFIPEAKDLRAHDLTFLADPTTDLYKQRLTAITRNADRMTQKGIAKGMTPEAAHDAAIAHYMGKMGALHTTNDAAQAFRDEAGHLQVVSKTLQYKLKNEVLNADKTLKQLYRQPIQVWRHMLLGLSPRYFVNNFIGNGIMLIASTDPVSLVRAYRNHLRMAHGAAAEADAMDLFDRTAAAQQHARNVAQIKAARNLGSPAMHRGAWSNQAIAIRDSKRATVDAAEARIAERHASNLSLGGNPNLAGKGMRAGLDPTARHLGGEYGATMSTSSKEAMRSGEKGTVNRLVAHTSKGYDWTNHYADEPGRWMAAQYSLMRTPEYQLNVARLMGAGHSAERASVLAARDALKMEGVRTTVAMQVKHMLGQYHTFTRFENNVRKNIVPFYSWYRALAQHVRHVVTNDSYKAAMGAALGAQGNKVQAQMLGQVPDFMNSLIPGALLGGFISDATGRKATLNAATMSPYGTVADITNMVMSFAGMNEGDTKVSAGDSIGSLLNPVLQGGIEQLTGASIQTGTPIKPATGGIAGGMVSSIFSGLPQIRLVEDALGIQQSNVTSKGNPTLYQHGAQSDISSFLGVPIRQESPSAAAALAAKQSKKKKTFTSTYLPKPGF